MPPDQSDPIRDYIAANHGKYTRESIRERLVAAGHGAAQIDAAWELEVGRARQAAPGNAVASFALLLYLFGGVVGAVGAFAALGSSSYLGSVSAPTFLIVYAAGYLAIGYAIVRLVRSAARRFRITGLWSGLLALALIPIYGALMLGTCLGAFNLARGA